MTKEYPNGSFEVWCEKPKMLIYIQAPNQFGTTWTLNVENKIYGAGGNVDRQGIHRRGRKWYPRLDKNIGWTWET